MDKFMRFIRGIRFESFFVERANDVHKGESAISDSILKPADLDMLEELGVRKDAFDLDSYLFPDSAKKPGQASPQVEAKDHDASLGLDDEAKFTSEFGGLYYSFPKSCTPDVYYVKNNVDRSFFDFRLSGDVFYDFPYLIEKLRVYSWREGYARERSIIKEELNRAIQRLLSDSVPTEPEGPCSRVVAAVLKVEKVALLDYAKELEDKIQSLHEENMRLTELNNIYKIGALPARTAHKISVNSANKLYAVFMKLIESSLYDGENDFNNALLQDVFKSKRELASATSKDILDVRGVGLATLIKVKAYFEEANLPCVASITFNEAGLGCFNWASVANLCARPEYKWTLPDYLFGEGKYLIQDSTGYSKLRVC